MSLKIKSLRVGVTYTVSVNGFGNITNVGSVPLGGCIIASHALCFADRLVQRLALLPAGSVMWAASFLLWASVSMSLNRE